MKSRIWIIVFAIFILSLNACTGTSTSDLSTTDLITTQPVVTTNPITTDSTGETIDVDTDIIHTYVSDFEVNIFKYSSSFSLPETYMDVEFTNISYNPLRNRICVLFDVYDSEYENADYYAILQGIESPLTYQEIQFFGDGESFSGGACFNIPDRTKDYRIVIGKYDTDNLNLRPGHIEGSAWIEWVDAEYNNRNEIESIDINDTTEKYTSDLYDSYVSYDVQINDSSQMITEVMVVLKEPLGNAIDMKTFDSTDLNSSESYSLLGEFNGLAPNVDYEIEVYISGNDGVDDFEHIIISSHDLSSAGLEGQQDRDYISTDLQSYHGLYSVIYDYEITETDLVLSYVYVNDEVIIDSNTKEVIEISLKYLNIISNEEEIVPLETGNHTINIPLANLEEGSRVYFGDQNSSAMYELFYLPKVEPFIDIFYVSDQSFRLDYDNLDSLIELDIEIYIEGYAVVLEKFEDVDLESNNVFEIYHNVNDIDVDYNVVLTITYMAYGREITVNKNF